MTYPSASAMALLASLHVGAGVAVQAGRLYQPDPTDSRRLIEADADDLGELEERGWLDIDADGASVTDRGRYWLRRWAESQPAVRLRASREQLRAL